MGSIGMRRHFAAVFFTALLTGEAVCAAERPKDTFPLWPDKAPASRGDKEVDTPTLTPFWADAKKATGAAMIVLPGGGYRVLAPHEGAAYAEWLRSLGIHAFVLK